MRQGSRIKPEHANKIGRRIDQLVARDKKVTAQSVIADATPENAVLHPFFEWSDKAAAERYRLEQARHMIRSVIVVYEDVTLPTGKPAEVRAFVTYSKEPELHGDYKRTFDLMSDKETRKTLVEQALGEADSWRNRWAYLSELATVFEAIAAAKKRTKRKTTNPTKV